MICNFRQQYISFVFNSGLIQSIRSERNIQDQVVFYLQLKISYMICSGCIVGSYHNESFVIFSVALQAQLTGVPHCEGSIPSSSLNNARRDISLYESNLLLFVENAAFHGGTTVMRTEIKLSNSIQASSQQESLVLSITYIFIYEVDDDEDESASENTIVVISPPVPPSVIKIRCEMCSRLHRDQLNMAQSGSPTLLCSELGNIQ